MIPAWVAMAVGKLWLENQALRGALEEAQAKNEPAQQAEGEETE